MQPSGPRPWNVIFRAPSWYRLYTNIKRVPSEVSLGSMVEFSGTALVIHSIYKTRLSSDYFIQVESLTNMLSDKKKSVFSFGLP